MEGKCKLKKLKFLNNSQILPSIQYSPQYLKQSLKIENTFKFCKMGIKKQRFTNFDLKYTDDENALTPIRIDIKIPLLAQKVKIYQQKSTSSSSCLTNTTQLKFTNDNQKKQQNKSITNFNKFKKSEQKQFKFIFNLIIKYYYNYYVILISFQIIFNIYYVLSIWKHFLFIKLIGKYRVSMFFVKFILVEAINKIFLVLSIMKLTIQFYIPLFFLLLPDLQYSSLSLISIKNLQNIFFFFLPLQNCHNIFHQTQQIYNCQNKLFVKIQINDIQIYNKLLLINRQLTAQQKMLRAKSLNGNQMKNIDDQNLSSQFENLNKSISIFRLPSSKISKYNFNRGKWNQSFANSKKLLDKKSSKTGISQTILNNLTNEKYTESKIQQIPYDIKYERYLDNKKQIQMQLQIQIIPCKEDDKIYSPYYQLKSNEQILNTKYSTRQNTVKINQYYQDYQCKQKQQLKKYIAQLEDQLSSKQLIKIKYQSEIQSLKLRIKLIQLKHQQIQQEIIQKHSHFYRFTTSPLSSIQISQKSSNTSQSQTILTYNQINCHFLKYQQIKTKLNQIAQKINSFTQFIYQQFSSLNLPLHSDIFTLTTNLIKQQRQQRTKERANEQQQTQKYRELQKKSQTKISTLTNLLNLAQDQIINLLSKLRQTKQYTFINFKQRLHQHKYPNFDTYIKQSSY